MINKNAEPLYNNVEIVILNIDKETLDLFTIEPSNTEWRKYHTLILDKLTKAKVVAFLSYFEGVSIYDQDFKDKIDKLGNVVLGAVKGVNIPAFLSENSNIGYLEIDPDIDGKYRRYKLIYNKNKLKIEGLKPNVWEASFILRIIGKYHNLRLPGKGVEIYQNIEKGNNLVIGEQINDIIMDGEKKIYIWKTERADSYLNLSYCEIFNAKENEDILKRLENKVVIIGYDGEEEFPTPFGMKKRTFVNAAALGTMLEGKYINYIPIWLYTIIITTIAICSIIMLNYKNGFILMVIMNGLILIASLILMISQQYVIYLVPIMAVILSGSIIKLIFMFMGDKPGEKIGLNAIMITGSILIIVCCIIYMTNEKEKQLIVGIVIIPIVLNISKWLIGKLMFNKK
jgi:CHASE2 domain-containing sensor protein